MKPLFHSSLYEFDKPQPSYWEATAGANNLKNEPLVESQSCDVAIIGGGYTGLSAALHLARDYDIDVCLLEAGHIGWGASGRNGGFCTMGMTKVSLEAQLRKFGVEQTRQFHQSQADAVNLVRRIGEDEGIDFLAQGDCEFVVADSDAHFAKMQKSADMKRTLLGLDVTIHGQDEFREIGYDSPHQHGAMALRPSFALHPLRYAQGLAAAAERRGARIHPRSEVIRWHKDGDSHRLETAGGSLTAKQVILTGNGFMPEHLHRGVQGRPLPLQSAIVVTRPMSDDELRQKGWHTESPIINSKHMFFYYRLLSDRRFLLGARADHSGAPAGAEKTYAGMKRSIACMWPQFADLEYTHQWRGLVCFAMNLRPSIGRMPEDRSIYFAYGYHGNGVNSATWSGRELAKWLAGKESGNSILPGHLPAIVRGRPPRFPLAGLRRQYLRVGLSVYRLRDYFDW
ncbi:MAG: FAD-binding oxidoreductase [Gammaproteobacteria bacterium]|nr:FAD-binding oxidoreductase [Gammaproteobacteria bacterium]MDH3446518.1 FAD-binding oxidoreductase [Gammaproteobacteria bacterium]